MRKGDYIEQFGQIGQVIKVRGEMAYCKFPTTHATAFDPVYTPRLELATRRHNGRNLYIYQS